MDLAGVGLATALAVLWRPDDTLTTHGLQLEVYFEKNVNDMIDWS